MKVDCFLGGGKAFCVGGRQFCALEKQFSVQGSDFVLVADRLRAGLSKNIVAYQHKDFDF